MTSEIVFPLDPLTDGAAFDEESRRRAVAGVLDSYHSNYDVPAEALQNAVDAVEDAKLLALDGPYLIEVVVNLNENWMSFLDTGIGMSVEEVARAFAPHISFKAQSETRSKRNQRHPYRGFKGIGLTFLAYGTDDITIHSKKDGVLTKARMQYGRAWTTGKRPQAALLTKDKETSSLERHPRGTYIKVHFSSTTRPKSLRRLASTPVVWEAVLRLKTAIGQVTQPDDSPVTPIAVNLTVEDSNNTVKPRFLYPHKIVRTPAFRFLDLVDYHSKYPEQTTPPPDKRRQDGVYLYWDTKRIAQELKDKKNEYTRQIEEYSPFSYAFVPYQGSVWGELNQISTGRKQRNYLYPGLMLAVNRQRLADIFEIEPTRYEVFSRNVFVAVHFNGARPDHGRKTIDADSTDFAKKVANIIVQYLAKQRSLLRPPGEGSTPGQRQTEKDHEDWIFNVRLHHKNAPLHIPPVAYISTPLTEQDIVGLFHQLCALGVFSGAKIYSTSQIQTYDCLMEYNCQSEEMGLKYENAEHNPLGLSPSTLGTNPRFATRQLTVEFKNNLDGIIEDIDGDRSPKQFGSIDICVCWGQIDETFKGYELEKITEANIDRRQFPGVTHLLSHNGNSRAMSVIMLKTVTGMIHAGKIAIPIVK